MMKELFSEYSLNPTFMARSRREKILVLLFLTVIVVIWFSNLSSRMESVTTQTKSLMANKKNQGQWLDNRQTIDTAYKSSLTRLTETSLPSRNEFAGQIDAMLRKYEFGFRTDPPKTKVRNTISEHTVNVMIEKAAYYSLIEFTGEIKEQFPYVALEQLTVNPDRRNPALLDARLRLVAIEFNR
jgi:hypothetical protein